MNDENCKTIERKALFHLLNCSLDDNIFWMNEVSIAFAELTKEFKKLDI